MTRQAFEKGYAAAKTATTTHDAMTRAEREFPSNHMLRVDYVDGWSAAVADYLADLTRARNGVYSPDHRDA
jgi:hypothetical protein